MNDGCNDIMQLSVLRVLRHVEVRVVSGVMKESSAFVFSVKQSRKNGLRNPEHDGIMTFLNTPDNSARGHNFNSLKS